MEFHELNTDASRNMTRMRVVVDQQSLHESVARVHASSLLWLQVRFNRLIVVVHQTLYEFIEALQGLRVMSGDLDALGNAMFISRIPGAFVYDMHPLHCANESAFCIINHQVSSNMPSNVNVLIA